MAAPANARETEIVYDVMQHRKKARWTRIDEWHRLLDEGHAALDFLPPGGNVPSAEIRPFFEHHYRARRPIVFARGHFDRPALSGATFEYLAARWGAVPVEVQGHRDDPSRYEIEGASHKYTCSFDAFLDALVRGTNNAYYMTANNAGANHELLRVLSPYLAPLPNLLTGSPTQGFLWVGRGSFTPIHHDLTNNLLFQLVGTKRITLYPPDMHRKLDNHQHVYTRLSAVPANLAQQLAIDHEEIILRPGEALFIPVGWWHMVEAMVEKTLVITEIAWRSRNPSEVMFAPITPPALDYGPGELNITYTSTMFPWDNHSWHTSFPG